MIGGRVSQFFIKAYYRSVKSIAFFPAIITVLFVVLAFAAVRFDDSGASNRILRFFPWLIMRSASHASSLLTTLLAGTVSLTVFSFSMLMLVLNQAAVNFTPKVLDQISEKRSSQFVMGFYIGSMVYYIILLINFTQNKTNEAIPHLSFFLAILFGITSIVLFVPFIRNITIAIQPKEIIQLIYLATRESLARLKEEHTKDGKFNPDQIENQYEWHTYPAHESGYLQGVLDGIVAYLKTNNLLLKIENHYGYFVIKGNPEFSVNRPITEEQVKEIAAFFVYYRQERIDENPYFGFRQLTEVAVKALSPSINDPGTAIICINYLTDLLSIGMKLSYDTCKYDDEGKVYVLARTTTIQEVLYTCYTPIRYYGKNDPTVQEALLLSLGKLAIHADNNEIREVLRSHAAAIVDNMRLTGGSEVDRTHMNSFITFVNNTGNGCYKLPEIKAGIN